MGFSSFGSILNQIVTNCSCLYPLVASGSFDSCLHQVVVTSCLFLHGSCLLQEAVLLVVLVLVVFLLVPNAFLTVVRFVVCLFVVVVIQSICADVDWMFGLVLKQFEYEVKKHILFYILFQKHRFLLTLIIADCILADQSCPPLLRSEWYLVPITKL